MYVIHTVVMHTTSSVRAAGPSSTSCTPIGTSSPVRCIETSQAVCSHRVGFAAAEWRYPTIVRELISASSRHAAIGRGQVDGRCCLGAGRGFIGCPHAGEWGSAHPVATSLMFVSCTLCTAVIRDEARFRPPSRALASAVSGCHNGIWWL